MTQGSTTWKRLLSWLVQVAGGLVVITSILGAIIYVIRAETGDLRTDIAKLKDNVQDLKTEIGKTNDRIDGVLSDALKRAFPQPTAGPKPTSESIRQANQIITVARSIGAKLDPKIVYDYGVWLTSSSNNPKVSSVAWKSLTNTLSYRTFLNADYIPKPEDFTPWPSNSKYQQSVNTRVNEMAPPSVPLFEVFYAGGYVPRGESARLETLAKPQPEGSGIGTFLIEGGADFLVLDGMYMKNVIIRNARVIYEGGPVRLEHVYFVNCTFILKRSRPTLDFGSAVLRAASTNFSRGERLG